MGNVVTPLQGINTCSNVRIEIIKAYLVAFGNTVAQRLAFGAQSSIALFRANQPGVQLVQTML